MSAHATRVERPARDEELVAAMRAGDPGALETLYDRHAGALLGLAVRMLQDRGEAEDLVHDVFVEAWRNIKSFDPARGAVWVWLSVRLRSRAIDRLRRRAVDPARLVESSTPLEERAPSDAVSPGRAVDRQRARDALEALAPEQRTVVELAYFGGLTFREIAARMSIPASTAKSRMVAAIRILRQRLAEPREAT